MIDLIRSELYRSATIRSSWISIVLFGAVAASVGVLSSLWWAMFSGIGAFGIAVFTVARHYQHRTAALLYLARPKRLPVLFAQVAATVLVTEVFAALTGITGLIKDGNQALYRHTLWLTPIMAVFGASMAAIVRRSSWLLYGFAVWFVLVEALVGQMKWPLPISSYLDAAGGNPYGLEVFVVWTLGALAVAALMLRRDLATD
jgi:hypothetical protein